ncbi:Kelch repeat-containing protein [Acidovorax sp. NCPPB 4044]|uniref:Kelch repeat-containing protein n=1 Tax=Acidovorax sp. NCPPB 4044 TaxID=2940490 RepID=UPI002303912E|nr:kelch repeat-containing protein [Acidovorax sp. NCPPB 4044]MDA8522901.1 galactose oxidase [Acidovorax sp. NCPPB 4044]
MPTTPLPPHRPPALRRARHGIVPSLLRRSLFGLALFVAASVPLSGLAAQDAPGGARPGSDDGVWTRLSSEGAPSARSMPITAALRGSIYLFGGVHDDFRSGRTDFLNDLYRYDVHANRWTRLDPSGDAPAPRAFAGGIAVPHRGWVVVFGGARYTADLSEFTPLGDVWAYDTRAGQWQTLSGLASGSAAAPAPSARAWPTVWRAADQLYVFGGVEAGFRTLNDLWRFDLATRTWTQLIARGAAGSPPPRYSGAVTGEPHRGQVTLYGGEATTAQGGFTFLRDTWTFDLRTQTWRQIALAAGQDIDPPQNHGADALLGSGLLLAGGDQPGGSAGCGAAFPQNPTNALWRLDLRAQSWRLLAPQGDAFPRIKRTSAATVMGEMYVFSGFGFQCDGDTGGQTWNTDVWRYTPSYRYWGN